MADSPAETTDTLESTYDVKIEDSGPARKQLTITVPAEAIAEKLEESIGTLAVSTSLPGFRKGRAPRRLLERRFGGAVETETKNQIVADAYATALEEHEIRPVGEPVPVTPVEDLEIRQGEPLTFSIEVEVVPDFELPSLEEVELRKPVLEITDERIGQEIERHSHEAGERVEVDGDLEPGDQLIGPAIVRKKGEDDPIFEHQAVLVVVPSDEDGGRGQVLGLMIDDLGKKLAGKKTGDSVEIKTKGPDAHEREDIRGADLTIEFTISRAERIHPLTTEKLVEHFGLGSEEILREQLRLALEQRRDQEQSTILRQQVHEYLLDGVDFELPEQLSATQAARDLERARIEMLYGGVAPEDVETRLAEMRAEAELQSQRRLKLFFVLQRLAETFNVDVSEQEVNGRIAEIARSRGERPEKLKAELGQSGRLGLIASQIREHKAADRVVHQARIKEVSAEDWNEEQQAQADSDKPAATAKKTSTKKKTTKKTTRKKTTKKAE